MASNNTLAREYIEHLPEIFRKETEEGKPNFLGQYLKVFEALLSGREDAKINDDKVPAIEERIAEFVEYLDPGFTPFNDPFSERLGSEFLNYLASWVALIFDQNWDLDKKRQWLRKIVPLYKKRGTMWGMSEYLKIFIGPYVAIDEFLKGIQIGTTGTIGVDTFIGGLLPYFFIVTIDFTEIIKTGFKSEVITSTKAILDLEKPAHTYYAFRLNFPGIIVGERSTVAMDTIIGSTYPVLV